MYLLCFHPPDHLSSRVHFQISHFGTHQHRAIRISLGAESPGALQNGTESFSSPNSEGTRMQYFSTDRDGSSDIIPARILRNSKHVSVAQKFILRRISRGRR